MREVRASQPGPRDVVDLILVRSLLSSLSLILQELASSKIPLSPLSLGDFKDRRQEVEDRL